MKTTLEIAHALRKAAAWERDPRFEEQRCRFHSARRGPVAGVPGHPCLPLDPSAVQWCATGYLGRELGVDLGAPDASRWLGPIEHLTEEINAIESAHDQLRYADAADLLDGLAALVEETLPVAVPV